MIPLGQAYRRFCAAARRPDYQPAPADCANTRGRPALAPAPTKLRVKPPRARPTTALSKATAASHPSTPTPHPGLTAIKLPQTILNYPPEYSPAAECLLEISKLTTRRRNSSNPNKPFPNRNANLPAGSVCPAVPTKVGKIHFAAAVLVGLMFDGDALLQTPLVVNPVDFHRVRRRFYDEAGNAPFNRQEAIDPIAVAWDWPCWIDWNPPAVPPI